MAEQRQQRRVYSHDRPEKDATELAGLVDMYRQVQGDIKALEEKRDALKLTLATFLGDAEVGTVGGRAAYRWVKSWPRKFDVKAFAKDHPQLHDQYRYERETRTFTLADPDE
jgi:hypothetical protein